MTKRDYYEILGLSREADEGALKSAYRKLAMKYHPDRNPGDQGAEDKFKEAAEAYSVLSDAQKRAAYDHYGHQGVAGASQGFDPNQFQDFGDILGDFFGFGDMFGGKGRSRNRAQKGEDLRYDLEIGLEDCIRGMSADIQVPRLESCGTCKGTGAEAHDGLTACPMCRGRGEVVFQQGFLSIRRTCSQCGGRGQIVRRPCKQCSGEGYNRTERKLRVNIPAGVDTGTRMRLTSEGQAGINGGPPGDLLITFLIKDELNIKRDGKNLYITTPLDL